MEDIQNATLAGGVAIGSSADLVIKPYGALIIGLVAGTISTLGFSKLKSFLYEKIQLHDTCGVHNLHGLPGILGGVSGAVSAAIANDVLYGVDVSTIFFKRGPNRNAIQQGGYQMAALVISISIAIVTGIIVGLILKTPLFDQ